MPEKSRQSLYSLTLTNYVTTCHPYIMPPKTAYRKGRLFHLKSARGGQERIGTRTEELGSEEHRQEEACHDAEVISG